MVRQPGTDTQGAFLHRQGCGRPTPGQQYVSNRPVPRSVLECRVTGPRSMSHPISSHLTRKCTVRVARLL